MTSHWPRLAKPHTVLVELLQLRLPTFSELVLSFSEASLIGRCLDLAAVERIALFPVNTPSPRIPWNNQSESYPSSFNLESNLSLLARSSSSGNPSQ